MATVWVPEHIEPYTHYPIIAWPVVPAPSTTWALAAPMLCAGECLGMLGPHSTTLCTTLQSVCREAPLSWRRCLRSAILAMLRRRTHWYALRVYHHWYHAMDCMVSIDWCLPTPITIYNAIYRDPITPCITPTFSNRLEYFPIHLSYIYGINVGIDIPFPWSIWDWWRAHLLVFPFSILFLCFFTSDVCSPALWWDRLND